MSVLYKPVGWSRFKLLYDGVIVVGALVYILGFMWAASQGRAQQAALDEQSLAIKAYGSCAFLLLTVLLAIGPLARLDPRFLPLLYNRRHFGVLIAVVATGHVAATLDWYFAYSPLSPWVAVLATDTAFGEWRGFPFVPFGLAAFVMLLALASTSHDFWLSFLSPPVWKALHMGVYAAYGLIVVHVAFGALQDSRSAGLPVLVVVSAAGVLALHLAAAWKARNAGKPARPAAEHPAWRVAGVVDAIADGRGLIVPLDDGRSAAIFRDGNSIGAISNLCAHQNGPLGEGRVRNGRVICPWHGYEYKLRDGCAPAPFTERLSTYNLRLEGRTVLIDPQPNPPGMAVELIALPEAVR